MSVVMDMNSGRMMSPESHALPWRTIGQHRCLARRSDGTRCDLRRGHGADVDHAADRGFDVPRWSDRYTDGDAIRRPVAFEVEQGVTCVVCPGCAFTFDASHSDTGADGRYTCPSCGCIGVAP